VNSDQTGANTLTSVDERIKPPRLRKKWRLPLYSDLVILSLCVFLLTTILASLCMGGYPIAFSKVLRIAFSLAMPWALPKQHSWTDTEQIVIQVIRLPRVLVATLAGAGLGLSGAALQGMMRNPLVGPDLVGVTSGAAFGGVLAMLLNFSLLGIVGLAFVGGVTALTLTALIADRVKTGGTMTIILVGVFIGAFFSGLAGAIQYMANSETQLPGMVYWLLGSFVSSNKEKVLMIGIPTLGAGAVVLALRWRLNVMSLGDLDATALGVNVRQLRWVVMGLVSLIIASQVSVSGGIPWIGLVVPHLARMLTGPDHRRVLPASALIGGILMLAIDDAARSITTQEIPVGLLTALIGTPLICFLFLRAQTKGWTIE
jgi:iron complex transport system permease protein